MQSDSIKDTCIFLSFVFLYLPEKQSEMMATQNFVNYRLNQQKDMKNPYAQYAFQGLINHHGAPSVRQTACLVNLGR